MEQQSSPYIVGSGIWIFVCAPALKGGLKSGGTAPCIPPAPPAAPPAAPAATTPPVAPTALPLEAAALSGPECIIPLCFNALRFMKAPRLSISFCIFCLSSLIFAKSLVKFSCCLGSAPFIALLVFDSNSFKTFIMSSPLPSVTLSKAEFK